MSTDLIARDFPDSRGIYYNEKQSCVVWVNNTDHLKIISHNKDRYTVIDCQIGVEAAQMLRTLP